MNPKITGYRILSVGSDPDELEQLVRTHLAEGWQPFGSPFLTPETTDYYPSLCQAMVKYESAVP